MKKYRGTYRIPSARLPSWDYGSNGAYFITICTKGMRPFFGPISNDKMNLSPSGKLAEKFCLHIPACFPYISLGNHVLMPNHVHMILVVNNSNTMNCNTGRDAIHRVSTTASTQKSGGITKNRNPMLQHTISRVIRWYKGRVTFEARKTYPGFAWQTRFHDHIIRSDTNHDRIADYITANPQNWEKDRFFTDIY